MIINSIYSFFDKINYRKRVIYMNKADFIVKDVNREKSDIYALLYHYFVKHFHHTLGDATDISNSSELDIDDVKLKYDIKLMKLVVIVHSIYLFYTDKELLKEVEAWENGTVSNVMWNKMKYQFRLEENKEVYQQLKDEVDTLLENYDPFVYKLAKGVNNYYGRLSENTLVTLSHKKESWLEKDLENLTSKNCHTKIDKEKLKDDYAKFLPEDVNELFDVLNDLENDTTLCVGEKTIVVEEYSEKETIEFLKSNMSFVTDNNEDIIFVGHDQEGYYFYD